MEMQTEERSGAKDICFPLYSYDGCVDLHLPVHMVERAEGQRIEQGRFGEEVRALCGEVLYVSHTPPTRLDLAEDGEIYHLGLRVCEKCSDRYDTNLC